jgi:hypothetical protein
MEHYMGAMIALRALPLWLDRLLRARLERSDLFRLAHSSAQAVADQVFSTPAAWCASPLSSPSNAAAAAAAAAASGAAGADADGGAKEAVVMRERALLKHMLLAQAGDYGLAPSQAPFSIHAVIQTHCTLRSQRSIAPRQNEIKNRFSIVLRLQLFVLSPRLLCVRRRAGRWVVPGGRARAHRRVSGRSGGACGRPRARARARRRDRPRE